MYTVNIPGETDRDQGALRTCLKDYDAEDVLSHPLLSNLKGKISEFPSSFRGQKQRTACVHVISQKYPEHCDNELLSSIIKDSHKERLGAQQSIFTRWFSSRSKEEIDLKKDVEEYCRKITDEDLIAHLDTHVEREPLIEPAAHRIFQLVHSSISGTLKKIFDSLMPLVLTRQRKFMVAYVTNECKQTKEGASRDSAKTFVQNINSSSVSSADDG